MVVQTDQQPRSRIGEQHGVFAVLVTVVRRRHRRPASALVARRTQVFTRVPNTHLRPHPRMRPDHNVYEDVPPTGTPLDGDWFT